MKALQITSPGHFEVRDVPVPAPGPGEAVIRVLAVTTCPGWDIHIFGGEPMFPGMEMEYPYTLAQPGHEACGEVVSLGEGVHDLRVGRRVCVWRVDSLQTPGCYAQFACVAARNVIPVPADLPPESCAALELAMCMSTHVLFVEKLDTIAGKRVGVFGLGPAGLISVQLLQAAGAERIIGFDPLPSRRDMAVQMGADLALDPSQPEARDFPKRWQPGCLDYAFDCSGAVSAVHRAMEVTNHIVVLFAVQREPYVFAPQYWMGLTLVGTQPYTREAAEYAAARLADGRLDLGSLVTHTMKLEEYDRAIDLLKRREAIKVAFLPQAS